MEDALDKIYTVTGIGLMYPNALNSDLYAHIKAFDF